MFHTRDVPISTRRRRISRFLSQNGSHSDLSATRTAFARVAEMRSPQREYAAEVHVGDKRITFEAYGVRVAVDVKCSNARSNGEASDAHIAKIETLVREIQEYLPPGSRECVHDQPPNGIVQVVVDGETLLVSDRDGTTQTFPEHGLALHAVDQAIRSLIAVDAPGLVFIHAGVVVMNGRALVLPGRSMAGKSTLVAELVRSGACYSSDEYAVLDTECLVHPYPRRLSLREATGRREVLVSELSGTVATEANPIALVAALEYRSGRSWTIEAMDQAAAAQVLLENAVAAQPRSAEVLRAAAMVARQARFVRGVRGEAVEAVAELFAMMRT